MTLIRSLVTVSVPALFLAALLGAPAPAQASHKMVKMCAKYKWTYQPRDGGPNRSGTTPEHCGDSYRVSHDAKGAAKAKKSKEQACDAAKKDLPRLKQGDKWLERRCDSYQVKLGG
jgi:hypothetical protein